MAVAVRAAVTECEDGRGESGSELMVLMRALVTIRATARVVAGGVA